MEQFSLEKYLENPSRKVVTRDGRPVRILCTDAKAKDGCCIIAAIETDGEEEGYQFFKDGKAYSSKSSIEDCADLFFADEGEKLTEFEKCVQNILNEPHFQDVQAVKQFSKTLLELARKELFKEQEHCVVISEDVYYKELASQYHIGHKDALKSLPKWKKAKKDEELDCHVAIQQDDRVVLSDFVQKDEYYITLDVLKKLPKEE